MWLLDAAMLNRITIGPYDDQIISPRGGFSAHWLPGTCVKGSLQKFNYKDKQYSDEKPMAILPRRANPRIHVQQGMFTVHGSSVIGLEHTFDSVADEHCRLARIDIAGPCARLVEDLEILGATKPSIFPELSEIAGWVKRRYG